MMCNWRFIASLTLAACGNAIPFPAWSGEESAAAQVLAEGRHTFRFNTFGDESYWGGVLRLHEAIEGSALGGIGAGVSPRTALTVGLKVDVGSLPGSLVVDLRAGRVNLDSPVTLRSGFYHDGRFATLRDVVDHYDALLGLHLSAQEKNDLVEYLKSL